MRIQFQDEVDESFLPLDMQRNLRLIQKQHVILIVLHQYRQQHHKHLLLTTRQLIGHQRLTNL